MVPGGGFEPPTRGFSVRCSTPELPGRSDGTAWKILCLQNRETVIQIAGVIPNEK